MKGDLAVRELSIWREGHQTTNCARQELSGSRVGTSMKVERRATPMWLQNWGDLTFFSGVLKEHAWSNNHSKEGELGTSRNQETRGKDRKGGASVGMLTTHMCVTSQGEGEH